MLQRVNKQLEKIMPFITPASVVMGVLLSAYLKEFSFLIPWIFAFMTFSGSLNSNFSSLKEAIVSPLPIAFCLLLLHVFMPFWSWGIGHVFFSGDVYTITGLTLGMAIPTGITSMIWVSIYRGNIAMTLSIILLDTLLSPLLVPYTLSLLIGQKVEMDMYGMMSGLLGMIVIPSLVGMTVHHWTKGKVKEKWSPSLAPFSKIGLSFVVMLNGAVVAPYLKHMTGKLLMIAAVVFFIALSGYIFAFIGGKLLRRDQATVIALTFTGGMRNISAGAVLAVSYFPSQVAIPVVIGMLFQQVLASLCGHAIDTHYRKQHQTPQISA